jgi:hypothetical protein
LERLVTFRYSDAGNGPKVIANRKVLMNRLPGFDQPTRRAELAAFLSLAAVAVGLIGHAIHEATRFAQSRDAIVAAFRAPVLAPDPLVTNHAGLLAREPHRPALTNFASGAGGPPDERPRVMRRGAGEPQG